MSDSNGVQSWWDRNVGGSCTLETFQGWVGDHTADSKVAVRRHVAGHHYQSILDCGCGLCTEYEGYRADDYLIDWIGLDATQRFIEMAKARDIPVVSGSIEAIPFKNGAFDAVYTRHVLEHLPYYEKALGEMVRVARKEAIVVFFIPPTEADDRLDVQQDDLYHNRYNREKLARFVAGLPGVRSLCWEKVGDREVILYVGKDSA